MFLPIRARDHFTKSMRIVLLFPFLFALLLGCPNNEESFVPPDVLYLYKTYQVGKNPTSVKAQDFNSDGFADLITSNIRGNSLSILFGKGDGSFEDQVTFSACQEPRNLVIDDFNLDKDADLAVACSGEDQVLIFIGEGNGVFTRGSRYPVQRTPVAIAKGDYNEDQLSDLVVALRNDKLQVFLGLGNGRFRLGPLYEYGDTPTSVMARDPQSGWSFGFGSYQRWTHEQCGIHLARGG